MLRTMLCPIHASQADSDDDLYMGAYIYIGAKLRDILTSKRISFAPGGAGGIRGVGRAGAAGASGAGAAGLEDGAGARL